MRTLEQIRRFTTRNFAVHVNAVEDDDVDLSFDDTGEVRDKLETGKLVCFAVEVTVYFQGMELGRDCLGGCIYENAKAFMDHLGLRQKSRKDKCNYGSYFSDMIRTAIREARKQAATLRTIALREAA